MICRGEDIKKVYIKEISTLIIESTGVSLIITVCDNDFCQFIA